MWNVCIAPLLAMKLILSRWESRKLDFWVETSEWRWKEVGDQLVSICDGLTRKLIAQVGVLCCVRKNINFRCRKDQSLENAANSPWFNEIHIQSDANSVHARPMFLTMAKGRKRENSYLLFVPGPEKVKASRSATEKLNVQAVAGLILHPKPSSEHFSFHSETNRKQLNRQSRNTQPNKSDVFYKNFNLF